MTRNHGSQASRTADGLPPPSPTFDDDVAANQAVEKRLIWKELVALAVVALIVAVRQLWLH